jgi:hypothetical protein
LRFHSALNSATIFLNCSPVIVVAPSVSMEVTYAISK